MKFFWFMYDKDPLTYFKEEFACSAAWLFKVSHCGYRERLYASEQPEEKPKKCELVKITN